MKILYLTIILIVISFLVPFMLSNTANGCLPNSDWLGAPCYALPGIHVTKEQMQKDWSRYYIYKGSQWMETKRDEMANATTTGMLKAWVCSNASNYNAWWYYYLNNQAPSIKWSKNGPMCEIPPLQQLKVGTKIGDIECGYKLHLLVNRESGMPACAKLASIPRLVGFGWKHLATYLDDTVQHSPVTTKVYISEQDLPSCKFCTSNSANSTVIIGINNTVRWINTTPSPVWFFTLQNDNDKVFYDATLFPIGDHVGAKFPAYLDSGQDFEYTFTKSGKFFWHTHPQFMGWVTVLPQIKTESQEPITLESDIATSHPLNIVSIKSVPPTNPGGPVIELTLKNSGAIPITNLKVVFQLNNNYTFDFNTVTPSNPLVSGNSVSDKQILIGAGFRTGSAYSLIISGIENNMLPFRYSIDASMP